MSRFKKSMDGNLKKIMPSPPDPGYDFADFLAYLMKRGNVVSLKECERDWSDSFDVESEVKRIGKERSEYVRDILAKPGKNPCLYIAGKGDMKAVILTDRSWADQWARHYGVNLPHHRQWKKL